MLVLWLGWGECLEREI
jgi:broad specificity phosphatase PhoE